MELDVAQPVLLDPSAGEGETVVDQPRRTLRILFSHELLDATWTRHEAGERGAEPHVHREHTDAFYVLEGELTFRIGPDLERVTRAGRHVRRRSAQRHPRLRQRQLGAGLLPQLPRAERRLRRLPARREPRVRQLRSARGRRGAPGRGDRLPARSGRTARAWQSRALHQGPAAAPGGDRAVVRAGLGRASTRTRTTITWTRSSSSTARWSSSTAAAAPGRSSRLRPRRCTASGSRTAAAPITLLNIHAPDTGFTDRLRRSE